MDESHKGGRTTAKKGTWVCGCVGVGRVEIVLTNRGTKFNMSKTDEKDLRFLKLTYLFSISEP